MVEGNRVLVVDDSIVVHKLMKRFLEPAGYTICGTAKNGKEAVALYKEHQPHITFMDITMPILDGIGALKKIKEHDSNAKIVMLSAMGDEEIVTQATELGASRFLQKPFNKDTLLQAIQEVLGGNDN